MSDQRDICDAADKLHEIRAKISMLQRLFDFSSRPDGEFVEFNAQDCWGVDVALGEIAEQLESIEKGLPTGDPQPKEVK